MRKLAVLLCAMPIGVVAQSWSVAPVVAFDAQFGGDTIMTISYTDGTEQEIKAGNGVVFSGGARVFTPMEGLSANALIGWKYSTSAASNIDVAKTAFPLDLTLRYQLQNDWWLGLGMTTHLNPTLAVDDETFEFEASPGLLLRAGWNFVTVGFSRLNYRYEGEDYDASSINIGLEFAFPL